MTHSILVLMSTYNGEKYLREQLDSLLGQENEDITILVRDDGSSDSTISILIEYQKLYDNLKIIKGVNTGVASSFYEVASYAHDNMSDFDYYAFCDQDDVWISNKLKAAAESLDKEESERKLYFCRATLVDENLKYLKETTPCDYFDYTTCVYRNPALGCTMVFSKALLDLFVLVSPYKDKLKILHDAWMFKLAVFTDATIIADKESYIRYRQHGNNVTIANKGIIRRYYSAIKRRIKRKNFYRKEAEIFLKVYGRVLVDPMKISFLETMANYNRSLSATYKYLTIQPWKIESTFDKMLWRLLVLFKLF